MRRLAATARVVAHAVMPVVVALLASLAWADEPPVHDNPVRTFILVDQLEYSFTEKGANTLRFNGAGWIGGDYHRLWVNAEGSRADNSLPEDTDVQALYGRLIAPFWDLQAGVRYFHPKTDASSRGSAVLGVQGLAPYWFEVQAAGFVSHRGEVSGRVELEYELLLMQRLILQPRLETNLAIQDVKELGIGHGVNDLDLGLRLRYEIKREFAPYVGLVWNSKFGETADFARSQREVVRSLGFVVGIRIWF
jgi:copper resistance protein B